MNRERPTSGPPLRRLTDEEIELWISVAATVARRPDAALPESRAVPTPVMSSIASSRGKSLGSLDASTKAPKPAPLLPLDRKVRQKLARGRMQADAALDLHGLRQAEAHRALRHFLAQAQRQGARLVLVVTGKGGRTSDPFALAGGGVGILKRSVPLWLAAPEFRALVIGFEEAGRPHGGAGALYVRLRRREPT